MTQKDRPELWRILFQLVGFGSLLVGIAAALIGPIEIYTFYLFEEGGRFHFEGFGFGSLMFGNIVIQIAGYYVIALVCIPLGYGHIKRQDWARKITLALLTDWLILGLPLTLVILLMWITSKGLSPSSLLFVALLLVLLFPVLPILMIRLYQSQLAKAVFDQSSAGTAWIGRAPQSALALSGLLAFFALAFHVPMLFNGIFPFFGRFLYELNGFLLLDLSVALSVVLILGLRQRQKWAWWGTAAFVGLMAVSSALSFLSVDPHEIIGQMRFGPLEIDALSGVPVHGYHLALFFSVPFLLTLGVLVASRQAFLGGRDLA